MTPGRLYEVFRRIRPLHELSAAVVTTGLAERDVSMPMRAVLERLREGGPQTVPEIGRALWITRQGVQAFVDEAKRLGYVETRRNPAHKRSHLIALTDSGRAVFDSIHSDELVRLERLAAGLDRDDVDVCLRVLDHLVRGLRASVAESATTPTPAVPVPPGAGAGGPDRTESR